MAIDGIRYDFQCVRTRILKYLYICMDIVCYATCYVLLAGWLVGCTLLLDSYFYFMLRMHDEQQRRDRYMKEHQASYIVEVEKVSQKKSTTSSIENEIVFNRF